jgi:hypothetical protein
MHDVAEAAEPVDAAAPLPEDFEYLVESAAAGEATAAQIELLGRHRVEWRRTLVRLLDDTEDLLDDVRELKGPERDQVVADVEGEVARLTAALELLMAPASADGSPLAAVEPPGRVRLQASWANGQLVVWAGGPLAPPAGSDELERRLATHGAPSAGWVEHRSVPLPGGGRAAARAIPVSGALGWLVALGAGTAVPPGEGGSDDDDGVPGSSLTWMGRVAVWAVRLVAQGAMVPTLSGKRRRGGDGESSEHAVRWVPALVEQPRLDELASSMPGAVTALERSEGRNVTLNLLGAVVDAVARDAAGRIELPAPPPEPRTTADVAETVLFRLDGSAFDAPNRAGSELAKRLERWGKPVTTPQPARLVVQLEPPDDLGAWMLSVLGPNTEGDLVPVEVALVDSGVGRRLAAELTRLERILPVVKRPGGQRRGQVVLDNTEAWELMTVDGPALEAAGFDVRVPLLSRRKPAPSLRLTTEPTGESVVGAHQLADVRWSAVFDDVELTAAEITQLATQARPLVRSRGRWVELDQADLKEAAAALAERADQTRLTGAEMLRHAMGLEGSPLRGGTSLGGSGWANDLLARADATSTTPDDSPPGFQGQLRTYQSEALAWLGFIDSVELGGVLALDMGLGKTPTLLAHLARTADAGTSLVIAPPAVVGNWAAEAARFTPDLRVMVHHGASRTAAADLEAELADADVLLTTYGTAVRDIDALAERTWSKVVLDEAQAIKNPTSETAQQLRRLPSRSRIALTGTPVENGLGDLWALLDFTNPGLVGDRAGFVAQLSGEKTRGKAAGEVALRALNGILVFRRTKAEPEVAAELPERIDELDHCTMTPEQIGLYQAVLDRLVVDQDAVGETRGNAEILAAITALKQICNHPAAYQDDGRPLAGRSGKLARLEEIVDAVFASEERVLVFTHFAEWGKRLATHLTERTGVEIECYHGGLARGARDRMITRFQEGEGPGALVLSLKAGGTGLNLTSANHVVLYDRWWNPAVEDQARDRAWRIGQTRTVISHRLVCPGTVDERVEEVVQGKRHVADLVLPSSSSLADLDGSQLRTALGLRPDTLLTEETDDTGEEAA